MKKYIVLLFFLSSFSAFAEEVSLSDSDLARETVLPVFRNAKSVKNRYVTTSGRWELSLGAGVNQTDALYSGVNGSGFVTYNFTETHAIRLGGIFIFGGLSKNGKKIREGVPSEEGGLIKVDTEKAPHPAQMFLADYQLTALYGKVSVTKNMVLNLSLYGLLGAGLLTSTSSGVSALGDVKFSPVLSLGMGFKAYFNRRIAFRYDLRLPIYNGVNPFHCSLRSGKFKGCYEGTSWKSSMYFPIISNVSLAFLF